MRTVESMVSRYTDMRDNLASRAGGTMYEEIRYQYKDMAGGGDGGDLGFERNGETTCRGINYKGYPDSFFREVCYQMGWLSRWNH